VTRLYTIDKAKADLNKIINGKTGKFTEEDSEKIETVLVKLSVDSIIIGVSEGSRLTMDEEDL